MKYITFVIPCYNSQDYMRRCVDSLLPGGDDVEILIIDDGSTDATGEIADEYEKYFPGIVKAVHKENGGHGSGVNKGLEMAQGIYYKVVDSDDWLDEASYDRLLEKVRSFCDWGMYGNEDALPDLFVCNYVYDHLEKGITSSVSYGNVFPEEKICGWNDTKRFYPSQYLVMHSLIFRTEILKKSGVMLPEHMFYVDNLFACQPLPFVERIYYINIDLYHYYLGRNDQSVNEKVLISRIDQQIKVTELVSECVDLEQVKIISPKLEQYMCRNISVMMAISSVHLLLMQSEEGLEKRKGLWEGMRGRNPVLYRRLKYKTLCGLTYLPGKAGRMLTVGGYRIARKIYRFQ